MYPYISIFGRTIGSYGLFMALGVLMVGFLSVRKAQCRRIPAEDVLISGAMGCGMGLLMGNLLYIAVTYSPDEILHLVRTGQFPQLFSGLVFYGGLIGGILGGWLGARVAKCRFADLAGVVVVYFPLGHALGRIGCLFAGCCYGFAYEGPFAVHYPNAVSGLPPDQGCFPVQLLEAVLNCGVFLVLWWLEKRGKQPMALLTAYLGCYAMERFFLEFLRGDSVRGIYYGLSASQWISLLMALCVVSNLIFAGTAKRRSKARMG